MEYFSDRFKNPLRLPLWIPTPANRRAARAIRALADVVDGLVRACRGQPARPTDDLLARLLRAGQGQGSDQGLTDREVRDEAIGMLTAGNETTANALIWSLYLLGRHSEAEQALAADVGRVLGGRPPAHADLASLTWPRLVLEEAMRLFPPTWIIGRTAVGEDRFGSYRLPAGAHLAISQFVTHRHPEYWDRPLDFDPERFRPERAAGQPRGAYFPFGYGPRACIGRTFAMLEMQLILAAIVGRYRVLGVPGPAPEPDPQISLRPRHGLLVRVERRRPQP
jgi:cytochrome P450